MSEFIFPYVEETNFLKNLRLEVREFVKNIFKKNCITPSPDAWVFGANTDFSKQLGKKGWLGMSFPKKYGGHERSMLERYVVTEELLVSGAPVAAHWIADRQSGSQILRFGTEEQKLAHLPNIAQGAVWWCQGYSEPSSGSDLASLRTRAEDNGDHFVINGQKIWTSGAQFADWIFCLVRTNPGAPKHDGISFVLFSMDQPGVSVRPIKLISGASPFCETFFDNAIALKTNLVGDLNKGWTVAKRLLQHERSGMLALTSGTNREVGIALDELAKACLGEIDGKISDASMRAKIAMHDINAHAFRLTQRRTVEESEGSTPGPATSIFKFYGANLAKSRSEMQVAMLGTGSIGWETDDSGIQEITRSWLAGKARSIAGGSNEVQLNIIAKRVLGLPD